MLPGTATTATSVDAGEGNDSVDTSTLPAGATVTTTLGAGDDTYTGGAASDQVSTGAGADTVTTGAGDDGVGSGIAGQPNGDKLDLGVGDDVLDWHGTQAAGGAVDLGEGANTLADGDGGVSRHRRDGTHRLPRGDDGPEVERHRDDVRRGVGGHHGRLHRHRRRGDLRAPRPRHRGDAHDGRRRHGRR